MIRISNIRLDIDEKEDSLREKIERKAGKLTYFEIVKKSIDARKKNDIHFVYSVDVSSKNDERILKKFKNSSYIKKEEYIFPKKNTSKENIIVVGSGPAGLMCALLLSQNGFNVTVIERGKPVDERHIDVISFWNGSKLHENSNVQFGEGGAGTFSDGKLNTGINDMRIRKVLSEFHMHGAPKEILYLAKPHVGTDLLCGMVKNIRKEIIENGGTFLFSSRVKDVIIKNNEIKGVVVEKNGHEDIINSSRAVFAIGHSARDTFLMLKNHGILMEQKSFSVGARIEHKQSLINKSQYGETDIGAADYKLSAHLPNGRGVYTFCMCPGGQVVASASENGGIVTNGMSNFSRDNENANSAVLVSVNPTDFESDDVLAGINFQRSIEQNAFDLTGKNYFAPAQTVPDFLGIDGECEVVPTYKPGVVMADISCIFPGFVNESLKAALPLFDKKIKGFASGILTAPETRSSSPVRILRDRNTLESSVKGLYPCGEGAGYAGGITSAAVDGIKVAEKIASSF